VRKRAKFSRSEFLQAEGLKSTKRGEEKVKKSRGEKRVKNRSKMSQRMY